MTFKVCREVKSRVLLGKCHNAWSVKGKTCYDISDIACIDLKFHMIKLQTPIFLSNAEHKGGI